MQLKKSILCLALSTALSGCATTGDGSSPDPMVAGAIGALIGGATGALVCDQEDQAKCAIGGAVIGGTAAYLLSASQQKIQAAAKTEGVNANVIEYVNQDGTKDADLALEYDWYKTSDSAELSSSGKEKLNRIMSAREESAEAAPLSMGIGYTQGSTVSKLLAQERAEKMDQHIRENSLGDVNVGVLAHEDALPGGVSRITIR